MWCIGDITVQYIAQMEEILHLYGLEPNEKWPLVCFDEKSYQVLGHTLAPIEMKPGQPKKISEKYVRGGTVQILVAFLPMWGLRFVWVGPKRRATDFAAFMKDLLDNFIPSVLPKAEGIRMVCDNLNTHKKGSLYKMYNPAEALDLGNRIQFHFTPVNASWLNMAEMEIHAISRICLKRRMEHQKFVTTEVQTLVKERNEARTKVNWIFAPKDARDKFKKAYSKIQ